MHNCDRLRLFHTGIKFARTSEIHSINEFGTMLGKTKGSVKCNSEDRLLQKDPPLPPLLRIVIKCKIYVLISFIYFVFISEVIDRVKIFGAHPIIISMSLLKAGKVWRTHN
jgi:hypothetical protein